MILRDGRRALVLLLAFASALPAFVPLASAQDPPAADPLDRLQATPADALLALGEHPDSAHLDAAVAAFDRRPNGPYAARDIFPPESKYRGVRPVCDLDHDGIVDLVENDLQPNPRAVGSYDGGASEIRALSGKNGTELWYADNNQYAILVENFGYSSSRPGQSHPTDPKVLQPTVDVSGDGVCDFLVYSYSGANGGPFGACPQIQAPLFGKPSISCVDVTISMLNGTDGKPLWSRVISSPDVDLSDAFLQTYNLHLVQGFPTGLVEVMTPSGPRFVVKTTDLYYEGVTGAGGLTRPFFPPTGFYYAGANVVEHLQEADAKDGHVLWTRDFGSSDPRADHTNITWISGFSDITGDGEPDVVLDQLILANPRAAEALNPASLVGGGNAQLYRNGRGMRMFALDGGKKGADLWATTLVDALAVQVPPPDEENLEIVGWTFGSIVDDINGDGKPDPVAQYLTEEMVGGTTDGKHRTHFVPIDGTNGKPLWDHPQQGWGYVQSLGADAKGHYLAIGTLDIPQRQPGGRFPPKGIRITGLSASDGIPRWTFETPFPQDPQSSYEVALSQMQSGYAPIDVDGDGVRDVVTPSIYQSPQGTAQIFLSTARQLFEIHSGVNGKLLTRFDSWGSNGLLLGCGDPDSLTFIVGHAKRLDLERFDVHNGTLLWRRPVWSYEEPRSSTESMDLVSLNGHCETRGNLTYYGVDEEAYSFYRQFEVVPIFGAIASHGDAAWYRPDFDNETPQVPTVLEVAAQHPPRFLAVGTPRVVASVALGAAGVLGGAALSLPIGRLLVARRKRMDPLGIAFMFLIAPIMGVPIHHDAPAPAPASVADLPASGVDAPAAASGPAAKAPTAPTAASTEAAPGPGSPPHPPEGGRMLKFMDATRDLHGPGSARRLVLAMAEYMGNPPDVSDQYNENATLTFPYNVGDIDGDGVDDVALDVYCATSGSDCQDQYPGLINDPVRSAQDELDPSVCGPHHQLVVVSGATGGRLWDTRLDRPSDLTVSGFEDCALEVVIGTVPLDDSTGLLVYRFESHDPVGGAGMEINHTVYLLDANTGAKRWEFKEMGVFANGYITYAGEVGRSVLLEPMLMKPEKGQVPDRTAGADLGLFVHGVGFVWDYANSFMTVVGNGPAWATMDFQPMEWLAKIDPVTGAVEWRVDSFMPEPGHSVMPFGEYIPPNQDQTANYYQRQPNSFATLYGVPPEVQDYHWGDKSCCGDLTGDHVPDLVFTTLEWNPLLNAKTQGPYRFDGHLVAFDGKTGARLWDQLVIHDNPGERQRNNPPYYWNGPFDAFLLTPQAVGDATGDGRAEILLHAQNFTTDYSESEILVDGASGKKIWDLPAPQAQGAFVLGDVDGDRGNDILFYDWSGYENGGQIHGDYSNVTTNKLTVRSGRDAHVLYVTQTVSAPVDLVYILLTSALNGAPDLDQDGVADFPVDNPVYLPDQITYHKVSYVSGRTGKPLITIAATGGFAYPFRVPDFTHDGRDDVAILTGDANDLWLSYHDGKDGHAIWAHRAISPRISSYAFVVAHVQLVPVRTGTGPTDTSFLLNIHMDVNTVAGYYTLTTVESSGQTTTQRILQIEAHTVPQLTFMNDPLGHNAWAYPQSGDPTLTRVDGPAPGTALTSALHAYAAPTTLQSVSQFVSETWVPAVTFAGAFGAALYAGCLIVLRRARP